MNLTLYLNTIQPFQSVGSSVLNTTFEVEPSPTESENEPQKTVSAKPPKLPRQTSYAGRTALSAIQTDPEVRSSDEFEKPKFFKRSVSAGMMRKKRSSTETKDKQTTEVDGNAADDSDSFSKKRRRLNDPKTNYFAGSELK